MCGHRQAQPLGAIPRSASDGNICILPRFRNCSVTRTPLLAGDSFGFDGFRRVPICGWDVSAEHGRGGRRKERRARQTRTVAPRLPPGYCETLDSWELRGNTETRVELVENPFKLCGGSAETLTAKTSCAASSYPHFSACWLRLRYAMMAMPVPMHNGGKSRIRMPCLRA